jgi:hypothetical protein
MQVDPVPAGVVRFVNDADTDPERLCRVLGVLGWTASRDLPAEHQPVRGCRGQRGDHADFQHGYQADLPPGRAHPGQAAVAERAAGERRRQAGQDAGGRTRRKAPQRGRLGRRRGGDPDRHDPRQHAGQVGRGQQQDRHQGRPGRPGARRQRGQHREGGERAERRAGGGDHGARTEREPGPEDVGHGPDDRVRGVRQLGEQQQRRAGRAGCERIGGRLDRWQVHRDGRCGQRRADCGEQGRGPEHPQDDRTRPSRQQAGQLRPRRQPAGGAQPARHEGEQE